MGKKLDKDLEKAIRTVLEMAHNDISYGERVTQKGDAAAIEMVEEWLLGGRGE